MNLTLEAIGEKADTLRERRKTFGEGGGTIGRADKRTSSHWWLPDGQVSQNHAAITFTNGRFYVEDRGSTNGIFVGASADRLERLPLRRPHAVETGDVIVIEPYRIQVTIEGHARSFPDNDDSIVQKPLLPQSPGADDSQSDWLNLLGPAKPAPRAVDPGPQDRARPPAVEHHYQPPKVAPPPTPQAPPSRSTIPQNWDESVVLPAPPPASVAPVPPAAPERRPSEHESLPDDPFAIASASPRPVRQTPATDAPASASRDAFAAVLEGAGLKNVPITHDLAENFGKILRVVVAGVMDLLKARQEQKGELGADLTMMRPANNNPLKFSADVHDALHNLLVKRSGAYLGPVEAFEDAFDDLRQHQLATLVALRAAYDAMLAEFDPERLKADFDAKPNKGALISMPAKLRYWELYRAKFHDMVRDAEGCYRALFGDEFARAYEEQLKLLKSQGRAPKR